MPTPDRHYGVRPDPHDPRDLRLAEVAEATPVALPGAVSLRASMPPVQDQLNLQACAAHATCAALAFARGSGPYSRLQLYYQARRATGAEATHENVPVHLRSVLKVLHKGGVAPETAWPYDPARFSDEPPAALEQAAAANRLAKYARLHGGHEFRRCLAEGRPFVIGVRCYPAFESATVQSEGVLPLPGPGEAELGGHALCVVGYDDDFSLGEISARFYEVRNSWGADWGDAGHVWVPAAYLESAALAFDAWTLLA